MDTLNPPLPLGYSPLPPGTIATVVTYLEVAQRPPPRDVLALQASLGLARFADPDPVAYRHLFRRVGENWLWESRLLMSDEALLTILRDPRVEIYALRRVGIDIGLLELDFRQAGECELTFFGLVGEAVGQGAGRFLMEQAIAKAWSQPIRRFWVHTCTFDHPAAVDFYRRSGFRAYASAVEVIADPRLSGTHPRTAAPHVPLIAT